MVIGNTYRLSSGDTLTGNLAIVGGTASIEKDATMIGDTILSGGTLSLSGTLHGDIIAIGGAVTLEDTAVVNGNLVLIGATLKRSPLAVINGEITEQSPSFFNFKDTGNILSPFIAKTDPLTQALSITFESLALSALAVILGLILPATSQTCFLNDQIPTLNRRRCRVIDCCSAADHPGICLQSL